MFWKKFYSICSERGKSPNAVAKDIGISSGSVTNWKNGIVPSGVTIKKLSDYFGVSVDYFLEQEKSSAERAKPTEEDIKVALFGGDGEVTDEMWEEVKSFAAYIKGKRANDKR